MKKKINKKRHFVTLNKLFGVLLKCSSVDRTFGYVAFFDDKYFLRCDCHVIKMSTISQIQMCYVCIGKE